MIGALEKFVYCYVSIQIFQAEKETIQREYVYMSQYQQKEALQVDNQLVVFIEDEVLPGLPISSEHFWQSLGNITHKLSPKNIELLEKRDRLQAQIDEWNVAHKHNFDASLYKTFLTDIGYLVKEEADFNITTDNVDIEISQQAGPQLVVPTSNARFALNAANARWGSLYDALYGTDVISDSDGAQKGQAHNPIRGAKVIAFGREFLDKHFALDNSSHKDVISYYIGDNALRVELQHGQISTLSDATQFIGFNGISSAPSSILLKHNGLHVVVEIDASSMIGKDDQAGVKDIVLEAALTTIQDFEDSVVAVNAEEKIKVYRNWLGLMKGDLSEDVEKDGRRFKRVLNQDREFTSPSGEPIILPGRSLMFCRNVGHLMSNPAILDAKGQEIQEGIMDAMISVAISMHDLSNNHLLSNSRTGSVYIVKPKMHGPEEVAFANTLFNEVEDVLGLARHTVKIGVMDEERRTTVNLKECIRQVKDRIVFINTGFLDRTGDEIHTSMLLGPMLPKGDMKSQPWISAYEAWNVDTGLQCGFSGKAQIGKGMWAIPDAMADMLKNKIVHPLSGANTAWVPSPTGAALHAIHYHEVNVSALQESLLKRPRASLDDILTIPLLKDVNTLSEQNITDELHNNAQGLLGYVVRWVDLGMGASKVPDINNVGLMEDRATLRISSQHICNWLEHGILTESQIIDAFKAMAKIVDEQNSHDSNYKAMSADFTNSLAFNAACDLVFKGKTQANGYTEPLLHDYRRQHNESF